MTIILTILLTISVLLNVGFIFFSRGVLAGANRTLWAMSMYILITQDFYGDDAFDRMIAATQRLALSDKETLDMVKARIKMHVIPSFVVKVQK